MASRVAQLLNQLVETNQIHLFVSTDNTLTYLFNNIVPMAAFLTQDSVYPVGWQVEVNVDRNSNEEGPAGWNGDGGYNKDYFFFDESSDVWSEGSERHSRLRCLTKWSTTLIIVGCNSFHADNSLNILYPYINRGRQSVLFCLDDLSRSSFNLHSTR